MTGDYLWDRSGPRDPFIVGLERTLSVLAQQDPPAPLRLSAVTAPRPPLAFLFALAGAAAAVVMLVGLTWIHRLDVSTGFQVARVSGAPVVGARLMRETAELKVGHYIETRDEGRVSITVANIGQVQVEPRSRLGLLSSKPGEYRLQLQRGTMHAFIWSPPGQFFVETPSSTAVDLGCAYTMSVDGEGIGVVEVSSGWVGFEWRGREAFIPAGAVCVTRPGLGPGTPHFADTSTPFQAALVLIDMQGGTAIDRANAIATVVREARERDTVTLWHLLSRVEPAERDRVFDRLAQFVPPPAGVTREGIRSGDRTMRDAWWDKLGLGTTNWWRVWRQPWREPR